MGNLQDFAATTDGTQDNPARDDDDGGSLTFFTQGEILFVTLTSFVIVVAAFFSLRKRSRENSYVDDTHDLEDLTTLTTDCISSMEDRRLFKGNKGIKPFSSDAIVDAENARGRSWRGNRRPSVDSHTSSTTYATAGSASSSGRRMIGANVSNQYKVAAIDRMKEMSVIVSS